ncbi:MAG: hypothetical protein EOR12_27125 [Mesorhizobium sp.]|uniref:hypothetical protein n=1 Tax=Mesorhizobium sp. TaxID=1871066 RepID=UPI000FE79C51|nr:hypothetical protein [Mesorhizobium sp.]RWP84906.1 MAG: hypothetical protein EOR12_27125 [Mesorhizobium sp.]
MSKLLTAYTTLAPVYPGYVNVSQDDDGSVVIIIRGDPETHTDRSYICGHAVDRGKPGRCTPGDVACNNYCNLAPEKGPMVDHPAPCSQTFEGKTATVRLSADEWQKMLGELAVS